MKGTDDVSLWPWALTLKLVRNIERIVEYPPANFGGTTTIRCRFTGYWARRPNVSGRGETSSLSIDPPAATFTAYTAGIDK